MALLDKGYQPLYLFNKEMEAGAAAAGSETVVIGVTREKGLTARREIHIYRDGHKAENIFYVERTIKTMLYAYGGFQVKLFAPTYIVEKIRKAYASDGSRCFDVEMFSKIYLCDFSILEVSDPADIVEVTAEQKLSGGFAGRRIGFDAGGSDRKVTATIDGNVVFDDETVWFPKLNSDPKYHADGIADSVNRALAKLDGKVDAIGVSTAGVVVDDEIRVASLFRKVPASLYKSKVVPIYKNLSAQYGVPVKVANDGDVSALAGAVSLGEGRVLGIAMGTSLAAGYIDKNNNICGYINELAFVPVDANLHAERDEWSGDIGVGTSYMSQDAVIKLMREAGIDKDESLSPAEKLKVAQALANKGDQTALDIYARMGDYFGWSIMYFSTFYDVKWVLFLGRVASGRGGELLISHAQAILDKESQGTIKIVLPDERTRRLGQSYYAASLVALK